MPALPRELPFPVAVFGPRSLRWSNRLFDRLFRHADGTAPRTIGQLLGKPNASVARDAATLFEGKGEVTATVALETAAGAGVVMEVKALPAGEGEERSLWVAMVDLTAREEERAALAAEVARFRTLLAEAAWCAAVVQEGKFTLVSPAFAALAGYESAPEARGRSAAAMLRGEDRHALGALLERAAGGTGAASARLTIHRPDDAAVPCEVDAVLLESGKEPLVALHWIPVRERAAAEAESARLVRNARIYARIAEQSHRTLDAGQLMEGTLDAALKGMGYTGGAWFRLDEAAGELRVVRAEGLPEQLAAKIAPMSAVEGFGGYLAKTQEPLLLTPASWPPHLPFRSAFEADGVQTAAVLPAASDGTLHAALLLVAAPRTARTVADPELFAQLSAALGAAMGNAVRHEASEAGRLFLAGLVEAERDVLYRLSAAGGVEYMSPAVERVLGFKPGEFRTNPDLWRAIVHPDDRTTTGLRVSNRERAGESWTIGYRILPRGKASYRRVRETFRYVRAADGTVEGIAGILSLLDDGETPPAEEQA